MFNFPKSVKSRARLTYQVLYSLKDSKNQCDPAHKYIANISGQSVSTVKNAIDDLVELGLVIKKNRYTIINNNKQKINNLYTIMPLSIKEEKIDKGKLDINLLPNVKIKPILSQDLTINLSSNIITYSDTNTLVLVIENKID